MVDRFATINNACVSERHSLYTYRASLHGVIICMNHYTLQGDHLIHLVKNIGFKYLTVCLQKYAKIFKR